MVICLLEKIRFQDEGNVIGSAIGFDPTQSVYQAGSRYGGYFEWLEANGDVNLLLPKTRLPESIKTTDDLLLPENGVTPELITKCISWKN